jgi:hypothetical protein
LGGDKVNKRLKEAERSQRDREFNALLSPGQNSLPDEEARELARNRADEVRARRFAEKHSKKKA